MNLKKLRKWNRLIHRDLGYIFFGMTIIYAVSGFMLNHRQNWDPNYKIDEKYVEVDIPTQKNQINSESIQNVLSQLGVEGEYKNHVFPREGQLMIFLQNGNIQIDIETGEGYFINKNPRVLIKESNYLHYDPGKWWTYSSDIYALALILLAISGLFMVRGKKGIKRRGAILAGAGLLIPIIFLLIHYYRIFD